jgi:hypothetical protein
LKHPDPGDPYFKSYNSDLDQYQFGLLYMFFGADHKLRPYAAGSLGFTHEFNSGGNPTRTDFSDSLGGGVKYELTRHIALRGDARFMPTYANSSLAQYCEILSSAAIRPRYPTISTAGILSRGSPSASDQVSNEQT